MQYAFCQVISKNATWRRKIGAGDGNLCSFIQHELAAKLNLPVVDRVRLRLNTFGREGSVEAELHDVVKAKVQLGSYQFVAKFIVHDQVNTRIVSPGIHKIREK